MRESRTDMQSNGCTFASMDCRQLNTNAMDVAFFDKRQPSV